MFTFEFRAMNSEILLAAEGDPKSVQEGFEAARELITENERRFTRFSETSELVRLNNSAGGWFEATTPLFLLVEAALTHVEKTDGLFDPSILDDLERAGYDRSMDEIRVKGAASRPQMERTTKPHLREVRLDAENCRIWLPPGMRIDLGGIAKGWIVEQAAHRLEDFAPVCAANAGGDMFLIGLPQGKTAWEIELEDPRSPSLSMGCLYVRAGAVATSSTAKRRWRQGDRDQHHLIDPRTGRPADTSWLSVTVCAPDAIQAEVLAKSLLIAGPQEAMAFTQRYPQTVFIAVDREGRLWASDHYEEFFYVGQ